MTEQREASKEPVVVDDPVAQARQRFLMQVNEAIAQQRLRRLLLTRPAERRLAPGFEQNGPVLQRVVIRPVRVRDGVRLGFVWHYDTRDMADTLDMAAGMAQIASLLALMRSALLDGGTVEAELGYSKRGRPLFRSRRLPSPDRLDVENAECSITENSHPLAAVQTPAGEQNTSGATSQPSSATATPAQAAQHMDEGEGGQGHAQGGWLGVMGHNRARKYPIAMDRPYLVDLGVVSPAGKLVGAMARKWRQINRFVEIVSAAWQNNPAAATLGHRGQPPIRIRDYGAGKGYLTFALHDYLTHVRGLQVETVGIERRSDLVRQGNGIARRRGLTGLRFVQGDIADSGDDEPADWVIALHACDTATDDALHRGVRQQALMMVCSPCCHRELRPQLQVPAVLKALLRHGIHQGQEAEMLTDSLRALLLEGQGYEARVFEFIGLEDTSKNKMILANRTGRSRAPATVQAELEAL
ncbi:MAG: SAM-dependent methyltransferase, partial [Lautropia sp.]|nr:SAM-dependent methyltransferase [Lautropia sp.]